MSWYIESDVDLDAESPRFDRLLTAFVTPFLDALKHVEVAAHGPGWYGEPLAAEQVHSPAELARAAETLWRDQVPDDGWLYVRVHVLVDDEVLPPKPYLYRFGAAHPGLAERRRSDVVVSLGNRSVYRGKGTRFAETRLTDDTVRDTLVAMCHAAEPTSLVLHCEQTVSFPLSYHMVYHRDPSHFALDVAEIVRLTLHGGQGYTDGRRLYDPVREDVDGNSMMFGYRTGEWLESLKRFVIAKSERLDAGSFAEALQPALIEDAILALSDVDFFYTGGGGLGIMGVPLFDAYVEDFYAELMERLDRALLEGAAQQSPV